jgi:hypothetical protein
MRSDPNAPADTRMMGIVHDALRRDLGRAVAALSRAPHPDGTRRDAIGAHVAWMMRFLHLHHDGEDRGLWPLVREREPRAATILDAMHGDHDRVAPLLDACEQAASAYRRTGTDGARLALLRALEALVERLLPHLRREEDETMPVVSAAISAADWRAVDQHYFVGPKSLRQLGFEGRWLLDGLDAERTRVVLHQVPWWRRIVLRYGFARRYRRHATACWGPSATPTGVRAYGPEPAAPRTIARTGRVETTVDAPIDAVWRVVADVTRVGEWSHECRRVEWLDGATAAAPGVRFRGTNKAGPWTWSRVNEIVAADAPRRLVWRTVPTLLFPDSSEWRVELAPVDGGTRIVQSYEVLRAPALLGRLYALVIPAHRDRSGGLRDDLRRLGEVAATRAGEPAPA